jgi:chromosomal replication initiator protein
VDSNPRYEILSPWMKNINIVKASDDAIIVDLEDSSLKKYITRQHMELLNEAASQIFERNLQLSEIENIKKSDKEPNTQKQTIINSKSQFSLSLNSRYTLDNFAVGPCNRLVYAAARAICINPGEAYSPLYINAETGMGKTHLLQGICKNINENNPELNVLYMSANYFIQLLSEHIKSDSVESFRNELINLDVLAIDNINILEGNNIAQNEFLNIFNHLHNSGKQIVISSNCKPQDFSNMQLTLVSRFKWGLVVDIKDTSIEMRRNIIRQMAEKRNIKLSFEVQSIIAETITTNIRELEGAAMKIIGHSELLDELPDIDTTKNILKEYVPENKFKNLSADDIKTAVCKEFNITKDELISKKRSRSLVIPRHIAMYLIRSLTNISLEETGRAFGNRDHSTVKHACEKIQKNIKEDSSLNSRILSIKEILY